MIDRTRATIQIRRRANRWVRYFRGITRAGGGLASGISILFKSRGVCVLENVKRVDRVQEHSTTSSVGGSRRVRYDFGRKTRLRNYVVSRVKKRSSARECLFGCWSVCLSMMEADQGYGGDGAKGEECRK